jgi:antirestriction protein ArdC
VFNAEQVVGYEPTPPTWNTEAQIAAADAFLARVGATVEHRSEGRAYYRPGAELIVLPPFETFTDAHAYYAASAHEHAHWTGHPTRLDRNLANRFGDRAYAAEELIAELSAAFTCATLGISTTPRPDHAPTSPTGGCCEKILERCSPWPTRPRPRPATSAPSPASSALARRRR